MRLRLLSRTFAVAAAATFIAAAARTTTPPRRKSADDAAASAPSLPCSATCSALAEPKTITPLHAHHAAARRHRPSPRPSASSVVRSSIPGAGLTIVVPPLAVAKPTDVHGHRARRFGNVAYDFEPHGTQVPRAARHDAEPPRRRRRDTSLLDLGLSLGYFPDASHVTSVTELLNVNVDLLGPTAISTIWHFSGYIYASGRDGQTSSDAVTRFPASIGHTLAGPAGRAVTSATPPNDGP